MGYPGLRLSGWYSIGGAEVYRNDGTGWNRLMGITSPDIAPPLAFGTSVALSGDGQTALIGTPDRNVGAAEEAGAAELFTTDPSAVSVSFNASAHMARGSGFRASLPTTPG